MRALAAAWPDPAIVQRLVGQLPWGHNIELLDKLDDPAQREWYAREAIHHGWSRAVLANQIMSQLHRRAGAAPSNFADVTARRRLRADAAADQGPVPPRVPHPGRTGRRARSRAGPRRRRSNGSCLSWALGSPSSAASGGSSIDGDEFFIDLLLFHIPSSRYVVIELKTTKLTPADVGQLNFYVAAIDGEVRLAHHAPTVGLLLCATRNERTVRYSLARSTSPMAVAGYRYSELPPAEQAALPGEDVLDAAVTAALADVDSDLADP